MTFDLLFQVLPLEARHDLRHCSILVSLVQCLTQADSGIVIFSNMLPKLASRVIFALAAAAPPDLAAESALVRAA